MQIAILYTMLKPLLYNWKVLKLSWKANGFLAVVYIFSSIYQNTFFPFLQIFILAQVLNLIQTHHSLQFSDILPYGVFYIFFAIGNSLLTSYANLQAFLFNTQQETYIDRLIIRKLTTLDPQTFEKSEFQDLLAQMEGIKGIMYEQVGRITGFISAIAKVLTAIFVLLPTFPLFIPLILISVVPSYYLGDVSRKKL